MNKLAHTGALLRTVLASAVGEVGDGAVVHDPGESDPNPYPRTMHGHMSHEGFGGNAIGQLIEGLKGRNQEVPAVKSPGALTLNALRKDRQRPGLGLKANEDGIPQKYDQLKNNEKTGSDVGMLFLGHVLEKLGMDPEVEARQLKRLEEAEEKEHAAIGVKNEAGEDALKKRLGYREKGAALRRILVGA